MDIKQLEQKMKKYGIVIRAIPEKITMLFEARHINKYPDGIIYYDKEFKRDMLKVEKIPENAGKFIIEYMMNTSAILHFSKKNKYYNTIEDAINDID